MPTRSNKHIKKFNQLVEVYEPDGVEQLEPVRSRERDTLEARRDELSAWRDRIAALEADDFFDEERETEIRESDSLPDPAAVAASQREEMLDRLDLLEESLSDAVDGGDVLDTTDDLDL
ncbi:hypothetical protein GRX03_06335 [Halovenus sp. WSH3]|uniref:Uncharacterized protein n=1 Tax=Halovenus carboxidivorans TaxID=2692199 RepID=A0A6B0T7P9_9EURY|nr:hypothetical protein [Halovenus carboxidivorans]MXR51221.1 hypothetical protein [Halovenus carboxidivorans]